MRSGVLSVKRERANSGDAPSTMIGLPSSYCWRGFDLIARQIERDAVEAAEPHRIPVDRDLAAADAEKAAEVDDGGARRCRCDRR